jgi:hypothetical protein
MQFDGELLSRRIFFAIRAFPSISRHMRIVVVIVVGRCCHRFVIPRRRAMLLDYAFLALNKNLDSKHAQCPNPLRRVSCEISSFFSPFPFFPFF